MGAVVLRNLCFSLFTIYNLHFKLVTRFLQLTIFEHIVDMFDDDGTLLAE